MTPQWRDKEGNFHVRRIAMGRELNKSGPAYFLDHVLIKWDGMHSLIAKEDEEHILITRPDGEDSFVIILTKSDLLGMLGMLKKPTYVDK